MTFVWVWLGFAVFAAVTLSAAFAWAVRNRQFSDLDRAGRIALTAEDPLESGEDLPRAPNRGDMYGLALVMLTALAVIVALVCVGWMSR